MTAKKPMEKMKNMTEAIGISEIFVARKCGSITLFRNKAENIQNDIPEMDEFWEEEETRDNGWDDYISAEIGEISENYSVEEGRDEIIDKRVRLIEWCLAETEYWRKKFKWIIERDSLQIEWGNEENVKPC